MKCKESQGVWILLHGAVTAHPCTSQSDTRGSLSGFFLWLLRANLLTKAWIFLFMTVWAQASQFTSKTQISMRAFEPCDLCASTAVKHTRNESSPAPDMIKIDISWKDLCCARASDHPDSRTWGHSEKISLRVKVTLLFLCFPILSITWRQVVWQLFDFVVAWRRTSSAFVSEIPGHRGKPHSPHEGDHPLILAVCGGNARSDRRGECVSVTSPPPRVWIGWSGALLTEWSSVIWVSNWNENQEMIHLIQADQVLIFRLSKSCRFSWKGFQTSLTEHHWSVFNTF